MTKNKQGFQNESSVFAAFDLVPSLLTLAGASAEVMFDGEDVSATLLGRNMASRKAPIFWRRPPTGKKTPRGKTAFKPDLAVRDRDWKLLCDYDGFHPQLYNLANDRSETDNLAGQQPQVVKQLTAAVIIWHQSMPSDNGPALEDETPRSTRGKKK